MSVTVDVNVLVDAANEGSSRHEATRALLGALAAGPAVVHLFLPVAAGFLRIATNRRIFPSPLDFRTAMADVRALSDRAHVRVLGGDASTLQHLDQIGAAQALAGDLVADAHLAALMRTHGTRTIWTADRDFRRFDGITSRDPLER